MTDIAAAPADAAETQTHFRTCPLCEATCGLEITTRGDEVVRIRGDRDDVFSRGFICPKGSTLKQLHTDPDRLRRPVIRSGEGADATWTEVSWDEAFAEVERLLTPVVEAHGREAVAAYAAQQPDWVLMDMEMPRVGGLAATRRLRAVWPEVRIVIVTHHDDNHYRAAAHAAGACAYVTKEDLLPLRCSAGAFRAGSRGRAANG